MARRFTKLDTAKTVFFLCDIQEKFRPSMKYFDCMVQNAVKLVSAGKILQIPLIASEQYPEKLGNIDQSIDVSHALGGVHTKTKFSMCISAIEKQLEATFKGNLTDIVLFGLETHVCVEQTAIDLLDKGYNVHIVADACMSRILQDRDLALHRLRQYGCIITTSETVIFSLMQDKNHPKFDEVRKLVKNPSADVVISTRRSHE